VTSRTQLDEVRAFYAKLMAASADTGDPRYERAFESVPREAFLPPGPWHISPSHVMGNRRYVETPTADPIHLYQNALVAIDAAKGINNGEPFLHAAWLGAVAPKPGEVICHIGAGTGYYTALLSMLALPGGQVHAFEIEEDLAQRARDNLRPFEGISVTTGDATKSPLPPCDLVYVNAGVVAPPRSWLLALRPGGRVIFPWRPADEVGLTVILRRSVTGFEVAPLMPAWFIPCIGASSIEGCTRTPDSREARSVRSAWLVADKEPDETAVAVYEHVWFSSARV
jgi:protein-L-isoaspartate(D-aspartate) O-methyltransferase